jgi:hypothetical protein
VLICHTVYRGGKQVCKRTIISYQNGHPILVCKEKEGHLCAFAEEVLNYKEVFIAEGNIATKNNHCINIVSSDTHGDNWFTAAIPDNILLKAGDKIRIKIDILEE